MPHDAQLTQLVHNSQQARQKQLIETQLIQQQPWRQTITVVATTPA